MVLVGFLLFFCVRVGKASVSNMDKSMFKDNDEGSSCRTFFGRRVCGGNI